MLRSEEVLPVESSVTMSVGKNLLLSEKKTFFELQLQIGDKTKKFHPDFLQTITNMNPDAQVWLHKFVLTKFRANERTVILFMCKFCN